eukprot:1731007-Amphidinium_carterae.1
MAPRKADKATRHQREPLCTFPGLGNRGTAQMKKEASSINTLLLAGAKVSAFWDSGVQFFLHRKCPDIVFPNRFSFNSSSSTL